MTLWKAHDIFAQLRGYLQHAQIGLILQDTLFVHGAVEESALGFVPSRLTRYTNNTRKGLRELPGAQSHKDLHGWIDALNQFAKDEAAGESGGVDEKRSLSFFFGRG